LGQLRESHLGIRIGGIKYGLSFVDKNASRCSIVLSIRQLNALVDGFCVAVGANDGQSASRKFGLEFGEEHILHRVVFDIHARIRKFLMTIGAE